MKDLHLTTHDCLGDELVNHDLNSLLLAVAKGENVVSAIYRLGYPLHQTLFSLAEREGDYMAALKEAHAADKKKKK